MRNLTMMTDLYELTMMNGYLRFGMENNRACWDYVDEALEESFSGVSRVKFWLSCDAEGEKVLAAVRAAGYSVETRVIADEDWENNWKQYYQPLPIGEKLLVVPEWLHPENPEHRVEVLLDPGMIFGTGAHASTQMCMRELERAIQGGERVLDLGSGSGKQRRKWCEHRKNERK